MLFRSPLAEQVRASLGDYAALADARDIDLGATTLDDGALVDCEAPALRTLIGNLIDNAIRYTPPGGRVDVGVGRDEGFAWLEVADSGPGIPASERGRVLDRFYRQPGQTETGSGLGLAIVKAIVERHAGRLVLDESEHGGLRVRVELPDASRATAAGAAS